MFDSSEDKAIGALGGCSAFIAICPPAGDNGVEGKTGIDVAKCDADAAGTRSLPVVVAGGGYLSDIARVSDSSRNSGCGPRGFRTYR